MVWEGAVGRGRERGGARGKGQGAYLCATATHPMHAYHHKGCETCAGAVLEGSWLREVWGKRGRGLVMHM